MTRFYIVRNHMMWRHSLDRHENFIWRLPDIGINNKNAQDVAYAGVIEKIRWGMVEVIYTTGQLQWNRFHVAVNNHNKLSGDEMLDLFKVTVATELQNAMNKKESLPSN